jgi:RNA-directed DNA polymerase
MNTRAELAAALGIADTRLRLILYVRRQRENYHTFEIPKISGGTRTISAPPRELLWLQQQACRFLSSIYVPKPCVHGFVYKKNVVTNAAFHSKRQYVVNFDLEDFFPSIHFGRVRGVFLSSPFEFGEEAATVIAQICCRHDGSLPQGGATSPLVSNLVCRGLDTDLIAFAMKHKLRYSRYADDLTFSSSHHSLPSDLIQVSGGTILAGQRFEEVVQNHGFKLNHSKVKLRSPRRRQEVTGLTANQFPNVQRRFMREITGALHAWEKYGYDAAQHEYESRIRRGGGIRLDNVLRGKLAYVKMVRGDDDHAYRRLARRFNRVASAPIRIKPLKDARSSKLRSAPTNWDSWISKYREAVFLLRFNNKAGDECCGSAFHIGGGILATAKHNVIGEDGYSLSAHQIKVGEQWQEVELVGPEPPLNDSPDICALRAPEISMVTAIPTELRIPELGEEVLAIGFPTIPLRSPTLVAHVGWVEALPVAYRTEQVFIQVSFQSGGGLSGGCLIDRSGHVLGVMVENVFMGQDPKVPQRPYGQAVPMEYFDEHLATIPASSGTV